MAAKAGDGKHPGAEIPIAFYKPRVVVVAGPTGGTDWLHTLGELDCVAHFIVVKCGLLMTQKKLYPLKKVLTTHNGTRMW